MVLRKHRFYRLELMDEHGAVYTASQLTPQFQAIMDADATEGSRPEHGLGILTAYVRNKQDIQYRRTYVLQRPHSRQWS